ncbi:MAG: cupredoxin domain-containing protein [Chloroflexi bacterium]|nr:cupredoxin domain-containing protein [Chloroflexota bacterium]
MTRNSVTQRFKQAVLLTGTGLALMVGTVACGGTASGSAASGGAAAGGSGLTVKATDFKFEPGQIKVAAPGTITITLDNRGQLEHDVVIEGVEGKLLVKPSAKGTASFKIAKAGTYNFACSVAGHKEAGMVGKLVVG